MILLGNLHACHHQQDFPHRIKQVFVELVFSDQALAEGTEEAEHGYGWLPD